MHRIFNRLTWQQMPCVVGAQLVEWLCDRGHVRTRNQAVCICQAFVDLNFLEALHKRADEMQFRDSYMLYKLLDGGMATSAGDSDVPSTDVAHSVDFVSTDPVANAPSSQDIAVSLEGAAELSSKPLWLREMAPTADEEDDGTRFCGEEGGSVFYVNEDSPNDGGGLGTGAKNVAVEKETKKRKISLGMLAGEQRHC